MHGLRENIADALFEEMRDLEHQNALSHHFNIMRSMKQGEQQYRDKFDQLMDRTWSLFRKEMEESHIAETSGDIVQNINALSKRTTNHYKVLIQETRYRFQTLLKRPIERHPLQPDLYYKCFWQAMSLMDISYQERSYVLALYHRFVMDRYGQVLGVANRTLIELKVDLTVKLPA